jgi:UPF0755 protein
VIPYIKENINTAIKNIKNSNKKIIVFNILEFFLIFIIIVLFYLTLNTNSKRVVFIPKGSTDNIITYLDKNNYDLNIIDRVIVKFMGYPQSGWIDLKDTNLKKYDFLYKLTHSKAALRNVILIPGETYYFFLKQISNKLNIPLKNLFISYSKYAYKLDGNILPQTYSLPIGMKSDDVVLHLINYTNKKYKDYSLKIFGTYNKKAWFKYLIIASIIQKEAASKEEMPIVSSVIYNRIKKGMKLQMDGTLNYGKYSHNKITSKRIRNDLSNYNTYKYKGLPSNPICAVEFSAIKSAIFPKKTFYLYFMKSVKGNSHIFTETYNDHMNVIKKVKKSKRYKSKKEKRKSLKKKKYYKKLHKTTKNKKIKSTKNLWKSVQ